MFCLAVYPEHFIITFLLKVLWSSVLYLNSWPILTQCFYSVWGLRWHSFFCMFTLHICSGTVFSSIEFELIYSLADNELVISVRPISLLFWFLVFCNFIYTRDGTSNFSYDAFLDYIVGSNRFKLQHLCWWTTAGDIPFRWPWRTHLMCASHRPACWVSSLRDSPTDLRNNYNCQSWQHIQEGNLDTCVSVPHRSQIVTKITASQDRGVEPMDKPRSSFLPLKKKTDLHHMQVFKREPNNSFS